MSKRDLAFVSATADADLEPRTKRRKDTKSVEKEDVAIDDTTTPPVENGQVNGVSSEEVKEQGLALWQTVKDAVDQEGRLLSYEFMRLPSKRQYPDYYELIKRPISLDEIKKGLDQGSYHSLEQVKEDIAHCFTNAKKYNQKESAIWLDAKFLHKMTKKEYLKMTGAKEEDTADGADEESGEKISGEKGEKGDAEGTGDGAKKAKVPNLYRQLKGRLQKLIDKTDDDGRVLSTLFMELPSKKDYPTYYKEIKRPQSLENIFRRLKRKEYQTSADFAADIELVFNNAFAFNQEHSAVWEDAVVLRDYFRRLMSDLPTPFALPEYAKPPRTSSKIKLKVPGTNQASPTAQSSIAQPSASSSFTLRVPGGNEPSIKTPVNVQVQQKPPNIAAAPASQVQVAPSPAYSNQLPHAPMTAQTYPIQPIQVTPRQPVTYQYTPQHYPNATYQPPTHGVPAAAPSTSQVVTSAIPHIDAQSLTKSPSPSNHRPLKGVSLTTKPRGRPLKLDYRDGVKSWAMRLGHGESAISVADVRFLGDDGEHQGSEDEAHDPEKADGGAVDVETLQVETVKRGRGRPPKSGARAAALAKAKEMRSVKPAPTKAPTPLQDSIKLRLNGSVVQGKDNCGAEWDVALRVGSNVLEIGEEGGMTWKVYMERVATF